MTHLDTAVKALCHVRDRIGMNVSDNKKMVERSPGTEDAFMRRLAHNQCQHSIGQLREHNRNPANSTHSKKNIVKYGQAVIAAGVGNCLEMSCAAASYLGRGFGAPSWDLIKLAGGSDHVFVAVGPPAPAQDGSYPRNFAEWPEDTAIVDVWADIACLSRNFPENWRLRIGNWSRIGMQLPALQGHGFQNATNWSNAVTEDKVSYLMI